MPKVLVLMSTYNGEKYVAEQILSIMKQTNVEVELLIRDDGSRDSTTDVVEHLSHEYPNIKLHKGHNVGFVDSFNELVRWAASECKADFYAFVDQDDVWYPNKLKIARERLPLLPKGEPNLFCSNSDIIDENGQFTGKHFLQHVPRFSKGNILKYPTLQGCSMVFNRKALELYDQYPPVISYHDRWMYMICAFLGATYYDHTPRFYYRIHNGNAVGSILERDQENILMRFFSPSMFKPLNKHLEMAEEFYHRLNGLLSSSDQGLIRTYILYRKSIKCKLQLLFDQHFRCPYPDRKTRFYFFVCTLFGKV